MTETAAAMHPMEGNPQALHTLAGGLRASARRMTSVARVLASLRDGATWDGPAGAAFGARLKELPPTLDCAIQRYAGAARAVDTFARVMARSQPVVTRTLADHKDAQRRLLVHVNRQADLEQAGKGRGDPDWDRARAAELACVSELERCEKAHLAAWRDFHEADRACAAVLNALAEDRIADSRAYRGMHIAQDAGAEVAMTGHAGVGPLAFLRPVAFVGGTVSTAAGLGLLLFYGEGSWKQVGINAGLTALDKGGLALRAGAPLGAEAGRDGIAVVRRYSTAERLRAGARIQARTERDAVRARLRGGLDGGAGGSGRTGVVSSQKWVEDWRKATANGPAATRMYATGVTMQQGATVGRKVDAALDGRAAADEERLRQQEDRRLRDRARGSHAGDR